LRNQCFSFFICCLQVMECIRIIDKYFIENILYRKKVLYNVKNEN